METVHSQPFKKRCDNPPICKFVFCFGERSRRAFVANFSFQRMKYFSSNMFTSSLKENYHYSWSLLLQMLHKRMFPHENETHTLRQIVRSTAIFVLYTMPPSRSLSQRDRDSFDKVSRFRCSSLVHKVACTRVHCDLVHQVYPIGDVSRLYRLHFRGEKGRTIAKIRSTFVTRIWNRGEKSGSARKCLPRGGEESWRTFIDREGWKNRGQPVTRPWIHGPHNGGISIVSAMRKKVE